MSFNDILFICTAIGFFLAGIIIGVYVAIYLLKDKHDRTTAAIYFDEAGTLFTTPFPIDLFNIGFKEEMCKYVMPLNLVHRKYPRVFRYNCNDCGRSFVAGWIMLVCPKCNSKEVS